MAEVTNAFLKSKMNQDLDARILPNGEYREAVNLQISRSEGSTVGEFEQIPGASEILTNLDPSGAVSIIGQIADNSKGFLYIFSTDFTSTSAIPRAVAANKCFIHRLNLNTPTNVSPVKLVEGFFLNFDKNFPIYGVNLIEDLLFFTDNTNQPRKINIALANPSASSAPTKYTVEEQISVAKYYPYETIIAMERSSARINGAHSNSSIIEIQGTLPATVRTGDIVTNVDKDFSSEIPSINTLITVTKIINNGGTLEVHVSKPFTAITNSRLDFSRPSMTNKNDRFVSNFVGPAVVTVVSGATAGSVLKILKSALGEARPQVGMLVTCQDATRISTGLGDVPANTGIIQTVAFEGTGLSETFNFTLDVANTLQANNQLQKITIGNNPDYNSQWKGNPAFLEGEYVRFSYRFKFDDNEYSLMAPFTQIMFIPKQQGIFGKGQNSSDKDMEDAYKSTILAWFENNVDSIKLRVPIPRKSDQSEITTPTALYDYFHITEIDILYKEADQLSVKVLDTVSTSSNISFSNFKYQDLIHPFGINYFYDYNYESIKPYKTLPEAQTVRVYDKVPIKALAQEVIGSRIVYGNYVDKHTAPEDINYITAITEKDVVFDNYTQFPNSSLKQNRTYQVGVVLSDQYGRQSDVILSSQDDVLGASGSTIFHSYRDEDEIANGQTFSWIGDALKITFEQSIAAQNPNPETGEPGWYSSTNPLGWYSYKIVIKQQEQDYYNVYLPGFVNGYPITTDKERNITAFTPLFGDNVNKVPRDLNEVGPNQTQYRSSVRLYTRVNNPSMEYKTAAGKYNYTPFNVQYFPGNFDDTIVNIQSVIDGELATIPFISGVNKGTYNDVVQTGVAGTNQFTREGSGKVPWGRTPGQLNPASPQAAPFYNLENNPLTAQISVGNLSTNPLGAICTTTGHVVSVQTPVDGTPYSFGSILTVAETNPIESLLEIFWETSSTGYLPGLNALIDAQDPGIVGTTEDIFTFPESAAVNTVIDASWFFVDGGNAPRTVDSATILSVFSNNGSVNVTSEVPFAITEDNADGSWALKTGPDKTFWYSTTSTQDDVYQINMVVVYTSNGTAYTSNISITASLTNIEPPNTNTPRFPATKTIGNPVLNADRLIQINDTYILWETNSDGDVIQTTSFEAYNGSANATNRPNQVVYSIQSQVDTNGATVDIFEINATKDNVIVPGLLAVKAGKSMVLNTTYTVVALASDCNGTGVGFLTQTSSLSWTTGAQHVNQAVCNGYKANGGATGSNNFDYSCSPGGGEFHFRNSAVNTTTGNLPSGAIWGTTFYYNVAYQYNLSAGTATGNGGLNDGAQMYIIVKIENPINGACSTNNEVSGTFVIQYKSGSTWVNATTAQTVTAGAGQFGANLVVPITSFNSVSPTNGVSAFLTFEFDVAGEYRVLTTPLTGPRCSTPACANDAKLFIQFGDATPGYGIGECNLGPL